MSNPVRTAIYARVSSEQQAKENTIGSQLEGLKERVAAEGLPLDEELCFVDDGQSGATLMCPAVERLRDAAYAGVFDRLYVHSPDRLSRKYAYQILLVEELKRCGVELIFLNRTIGESPEEDLLLQMQGMISEYERAKILERSRRGKRHAARRGLVNVLCGAPFGYRYVSKRRPAGRHVIRSCLNKPGSSNKSSSGLGETESPCGKRAGGWKARRFPARAARPGGIERPFGGSSRIRPTKGWRPLERRGSAAPASSPPATQSDQVVAAHLFDLRHAAAGTHHDSRPCLGQ